MATPINDTEPATKADPIDWRSRACITIKEAAHVLSTPPSQLRKLCRQGDLNPITGMGRKWRIATEDIERLLGTRLRTN
jgi:excisionase family DNA binding protein